MVEQETETYRQTCNFNIAWNARKRFQVKLWCEKHTESCGDM